MKKEILIKNIKNKHDVGEVTEILSDIVKHMIISDFGYIKTLGAEEIYKHLAKIFATDVVGVGLILRWLLGQVTAPLSKEHSREQANRIAEIL